MKIAKVEAIPLKIPSIHGLWYDGYTGPPEGTTDLALIRIQCNDGTIGYGDAESMAWSEPTGTVVELVNKEIGPSLVGEDPLQSIDRIHEKLDNVGMLGPSCGGAYPNTKNALISAIYDIKGKIFNVPIYELLGGRYVEKIPILPRAYMMGGNLDRLRRKCEADRKAGFTHGYAIKVGWIEPWKKISPFQRDIDAVRIVREIMGNNEEIIYADANGAWDTKTAIRVVREMEEYGPLAIEAPIPGWDLNGLAEVVRGTSAHIMTDEACWSFVDLRNIVEKQAADIVILYPEKSAGIDYMKTMAQWAERCGIASTCANTATGIGISASAHCVASTRNLLRHPSQLNGPMELADDVIKGGPFKYEKGFLKLPEGVGLGVELDEKKVEKYRTDKD